MCVCVCVCVRFFRGHHIRARDGTGSLGLVPLPVAVRDQERGAKVAVGSEARVAPRDTSCRAVGVHELGCNRSCKIRGQLRLEGVVISLAELRFKDVECIAGASVRAVAGRDGPERARVRDHLSVAFLIASIVDGLIKRS